MKRYLLLVTSILLFGLSSCEVKVIKQEGDRRIEVLDPHYFGNSRIKYVEFDKHEYVFYRDGYKGSLCHSPNCPCLEEYKK